jgi:myosin heavy subunit
MASTYDVGTKAWQPDAAEGWVASELVSKTADGGKAKLVFKLENGEVCKDTPYSTRLVRVYRERSANAACTGENYRGP